MSIGKFNLPFEKLVVGECYTTTFRTQGEYTFVHGQELWYGHKYKSIQTVNGQFVPENGFIWFRLASQEEKDFLYGGPVRAAIITIKKEIGL